MIYCGIYKITNLIDGKIYIGQSRDIKRRWKDEKNHAYSLNNSEYDTYKSRAFRKYGLKNFSFEILEECEVNKLDEREQYWANHFNSYIPNGYNVATCGIASWHFSKLNRETLNSIIKELQETDISETELAKKYKVSLDTISKINVGARCHQDNLEYPLRKTGNHCIVCGKLIDHKATYCPECYAKSQQKFSDSQLLSSLEEIYRKGFSFVGRKFNVTSNAIAKRLKRLQIPYHIGEFRTWYETKNSK